MTALYTLEWAELIKMLHVARDAQHQISESTLLTKVCIRTLAIHNKQMAALWYRAKELARKPRLLCIEQ